VIHTHLGYNIVAIQEQLMGIASLIKSKSEKRISGTDSTYCINISIL
jgi:hypothetical protein